MLVEALLIIWAVLILMALLLATISMFPNSKIGTKASAVLLYIVDVIKYRRLPCRECGMFGQHKGDCSESNSNH